MNWGDFMTLKFKNIIFISGLTLLFLILWGIGLLADTPQGYSGLGATTDLSPDDQVIAFSYYHDGDASLYTVPVTGGRAELLAEPEEGTSYINPVFSPDGKNIAFIKQWDENEEPFGELMMINIENESIDELTSEGNHVTDAAFAPNGKELYLLQSSVYENYSPIASEHPHGFDIFHLDLKTNQIEQLTNEDAYEMSDIAVTPDGEQIMYHSYRDDDILAFYSLESEMENAFVPKGADLKESIISSPALADDGERVVFSGVAGEDGNYIYEGFIVDLNTKEAKKVTSFNEHVTSPVFFNHQNKLLVTVDENFAGAEPANGYWIIDLDKEDSRQWVEIKMSEKES